jgi:hypothetical protein
MHFSQGTEVDLQDEARELIIRNVNSIMSNLEFPRLLLLNEIAEQIPSVIVAPKQTDVILIDTKISFEEDTGKHMLLLNATSEISKVVEEKLKGKQNAQIEQVAKEKNIAGHSKDVDEQASPPSYRNMNTLQTQSQQPICLPLTPKEIPPQPQSIQESHRTKRGSENASSTPSQPVERTSNETQRTILEEDSSIEERQEESLSKEDSDERRDNHKKKEQGSDFQTGKRTSSTNNSAEPKRRKGTAFDSNVFVEFSKSSPPEPCENLTHYCIVFNHSSL